MASFWEHIQPGYASTRKVEPIWILVKKRWWGGSGISRTIYKSFSPRCRQITMPAAHHALFKGQMLFWMLNQQINYSISDRCLAGLKYQCCTDVKSHTVHERWSLHGMLESRFVVSFLILFAMHLFWVTQSWKGQMTFWHMTDKGAWHGHSYRRALAARAPPISGLDFFETELPTWNLHYLCTVWFLFKAKFFTTVNIRCVSKKRPTFDLL